MKKIQKLEEKRGKIKKGLIEVGDMRRGSVTEQYLPVKHKGKKEPVLCGPYYVFSTKVGGKTVGQRLQIGSELEKVRREVGNFHRFQDLCKDLVEVNERICELRPSPKDEQRPLKKKLQRRSKKKQGEK
jgi:hypothetical protein